MHKRRFCCKGTAVIQIKNCVGISDAGMADINNIVIDAERRVHSDDVTLHAVNCDTDSDLMLEIAFAELIKVVQKPNVCSIFVRVDDDTARRVADIDAKLITCISTTYDVPQDIVRLRYLSAIRSGKLKIRVDQASKVFVGDRLSDLQHATKRLHCRILMDQVWVMTDCSWCGGIWRLITAKAEHTAGCM